MFKVKKLDIVICSLLLFAVCLWFFGFYFSNTLLGKVMYFGLPLWSFVCAVLPGVLVIFATFIILQL